jgi:hypothetical protein
MTQEQQSETQKPLEQKPVQDSIAEETPQANSSLDLQADPREFSHLIQKQEVQVKQ